MPSVEPKDAERRVRVTLNVTQKAGPYSRDTVGEAVIVAEYPLDLEALVGQFRSTLGLVAGNVDVAFGVVPIVADVPVAAPTVDVAPDGLEALPF